MIEFHSNFFNSYNGRTRVSPSKDLIIFKEDKLMNVKGIFKSIVAGATIIGGAILGLEAKKSFTKPVSNTEFDDTELEELENLEAAEDPAEEAENDEPAEEAED